MIVEGIPYSRYVVRYTTTAGKRRRKVIWCPGRPWLSETIDRWVSYEGIAIKPGSNMYVRVSS